MMNLKNSKQKFNLGEKSYYNEFGKHLKLWLYQEHGNLKKAAFNLGVSAAYISKVIHQEPPSDEIKNRLIDRGFPASLFEKINAMEVLNLAECTVEDLRFIIIHQRNLIEQKDNVQKILESRVRELQAKLFGK